jgi:dipeptidyl-peptidase-3
MKNTFIILSASLLTLFSAGCGSNQNSDKQSENQTDTTTFEVKVDRFADLQILKYQVPGLDKLSPKQQEYVYYLSEAAKSGRDIIYAQNYKHNLQIRRMLEQIFEHYQGDRSGEGWTAFTTYLKRVWFSNGIHHHYSEKKFVPEFSIEYWKSLMDQSPEAEWPLLQDESVEDMVEKLTPVIFDPSVDAKKVNKADGADKVAGSANNYYGDGVTEAEAVAFYQDLSQDAGDHPISFGLNSRLVKEDGNLVEKTYHVDGLYGPAIKEMIKWLEKAKGVAENEDQVKYIDLLIQYYKTGDLSTWDECNIQWVNTAGDIDFIHGFIEVYGDALGYKASYESVIQITDFDASARMKVMADNVQWFEDNSPIMDEHKKENVQGVTYKVVNVAMEAGDCAPSTPIGINLPNANWIRKEHGSKSVSLGNIVQAYNDAGGSSTIDEFYYTEEQAERRKKYGKLAGKLHTAMHEVIGHASGQLNPGVGQPNETLKNYSNTLEEARADLVALYFVMDQKLVDLGLTESLDVGKAEYDGYINNGLMLQLRRLEPGDNVEEDHMRNRQLVAAWAFEKGKSENVIERIEKDGKTYFNITDYDKLRELFGQLLREIQRIKSEGDFESAKELVETYGVIADQDLIAEVKKRYKPFNLAPYSGFLQPTLTPVMENGTFKELSVSYPESFEAQMMEYGKKYSFLPHSTNQ